MNELTQFLSYTNRVFGLARMMRGIRDRRLHPKIPTRALVMSLLLGVVVRTGSYLDLSRQTQRRRWRHLIHWPQRSDDAFDDVSERFRLEDLRQSLAETNRRLNANKALESCRINGLFFLSLDANEHLHNRSRTCRCCAQRQIQETDAEGQKHTLTEYYRGFAWVSSAARSWRMIWIWLGRRRYPGVMVQERA